MKRLCIGSLLKFSTNARIAEVFSELINLFVFQAQELLQFLDLDLQHLQGARHTLILPHGLNFSTLNRKDDDLMMSVLKTPLT